MCSEPELQRGRANMTERLLPTTSLILEGSGETPGSSCKTGKMDGGGARTGSPMGKDRIDPWNFFFSFPAYFCERVRISTTAGFSTRWKCVAFRLILFFDTHYRYNKKKYNAATMQMINNPRKMDEIRALTSKMAMLKRIVPIVRIRLFFDAILLLLYLVYFAGSASNFFLHPGAQKKYFLPLYSLMRFVLFSSTIILQIGSIAIRVSP